NLRDSTLEDRLWRLSPFLRQHPCSAAVLSRNERRACSILGKRRGGMRRGDPRPRMVFWWVSFTTTPNYTVFEPFPGTPTPPMAWELLCLWAISSGTATASPATGQEIEASACCKRRTHTCPAGSAQPWCSPSLYYAP